MYSPGAPDVFFLYDHGNVVPFKQDASRTASNREGVLGSTCQMIVTGLGSLVTISKPGVNKNDPVQMNMVFDQAAILACLSIDLNPIHAEIALTPKGSDFQKEIGGIENDLSRKNRVWEVCERNR